MMITEFLLARIVEDEVAARDAALSAGDRGFGDERVDSGKEWVESYHEVARRRVLPDQDKKVIADCGSFVGLSIAPHVSRHDPARVLAECEAKRRIVAEVEKCRSMIPAHVLGDGDEHEAVIVDWCEATVLPLLARVYAVHPDYDQAWNVA